MKAKVVKGVPLPPDEAVLEEAAALLRKGRVIACPTDTGYAFSANALDSRAVARVYNLKGRTFSNPIHIAVSSLEMAERYAHITDAARFLARRYLPGALTIVLKKKEIVPSILVAGLDTVGIRIPDCRVVLRLAEICDFPLTATSANRSGSPSTYSVEEIISQLGDDIRELGMLLDQGPIKIRDVSTIVDLTVSPPQLIRQGRIGWLEIREALQLHYRERQQNS
ncbi:MAG: L-threonylcarbamoyladenylate synthase [Dehalococcoidales bacterium]|nr:L-threonylcarbamoyladenylate synthase [Dehalococcoidales bacterium]